MSHQYQSALSTALGTASGRKAPRQGDGLIATLPVGWACSRLPCFPPLSEHGDGRGCEEPGLWCSGQADGLSPAGAGVFFLSSAEGEQISFLFDCIVRGISPTKGPFGLRPVLPGAWGPWPGWGPSASAPLGSWGHGPSSTGLSCWDTQATTAGWDGRANQKRSARWGQPETPAPGGAPAHLLSSPGPQTGVGGKPEVTGTVGWGGAGAAGGVPHLVPFPAYGPVLSSSVWAGASWLDLLAGVVAPSAGAVPPCNLVWHGRRVRTVGSWGYLQPCCGLGTHQGSPTVLGSP